MLSSYKLTAGIEALRQGIEGFNSFQYKATLGPNKLALVPPFRVPIYQAVTGTQLVPKE